MSILKVMRPVKLTRTYYLSESFCPLCRGHYRDIDYTEKPTHCIDCMEEVDLIEQAKLKATRMLEKLNDADVLFPLIILGVLALILIGVYGSVKRTERLMGECMNDGKKEYECASMLKSNDSYHSMIFMSGRR